MSVSIYAFILPTSLLFNEGKMLDGKYLALVKIGDTIRITEDDDYTIRTKEYKAGMIEDPVQVHPGKGWTNFRKIKRDYDVHRVLKDMGLHHKTDESGNEWYNIPVSTPYINKDKESLDNIVIEARAFIDKIITELDGQKAREYAVPRIIQTLKLNEAMAIIAACVILGKSCASLIANLCPRFGKTLWALMLFNRISDTYGNKVMLLPAYWLSVHTSFSGTEGELDRYKDFEDIHEINTDDPKAGEIAEAFLAQGERVLIPISLHGSDFNEWCKKHAWITSIPLDTIFVFGDEGDFGSHTDNQVAKMKFLLDR